MASSGFYWGIAIGLVIFFVKTVNNKISTKMYYRLNIQVHVLGY